MSCLLGKNRKRTEQNYRKWFQSRRADVLITDGKAGQGRAFRKDTVTVQYSPVMLLPDLRRFSSAIQTNWVPKELLCKVLPGAFWERRRLATDQGRITTFRYPCPAFLKGKNKNKTNKKTKQKNAGWQQRIPRFWRPRYPTAGKVER